MLDEIIPETRAANPSNSDFSHTPRIAQTHADITQIIIATRADDLFPFASDSNFIAFSYCLIRVILN